MRNFLTLFKDRSRVTRAQCLGEKKNQNTFYVFRRKKCFYFEFERQPKITETVFPKHCAMREVRLQPAESKSDKSISDLRDARRII